MRSGLVMASGKPWDRGMRRGRGRQCDRCRWCGQGRSWIGAGNGVGAGHRVGAGHVIGVAIGSGQAVGVLAGTAMSCRLRRASDRRMPWRRGRKGRTRGVHDEGAWRRIRGGIGRTPEGGSDLALAMGRALPPSVARPATCGPQATDVDVACGWMLLGGIIFVMVHAPAPAAAPCDSGPPGATQAAHSAAALGAVTCVAQSRARHRTRA